MSSSSVPLLTPNWTQTTLFLTCAGNELFYVALYLMKWDHSPTGISLFGDLPWAQLLFYFSFIFWAYKNFVNVVQLWKASKILVGVDLADRARAREEVEIMKKSQKK